MSNPTIPFFRRFLWKVMMMNELSQLTHLQIQHILLWYPTHPKIILYSPIQLSTHMTSSPNSSPPNQKKKANSKNLSSSLLHRAWLMRVISLVWFASYCIIVRVYLRCTQRTVTAGSSCQKKKEANSSVLLSFMFTCSLY